jgi:hypothetical protein
MTSATRAAWPGASRSRPPPLRARGAAPPRLAGAAPGGPTRGARPPGAARSVVAWQSYLYRSCPILIGLIPLSLRTRRAGDRGRAPFRAARRARPNRWDPLAPPHRLPAVSDFILAYSRDMGRGNSREGGGR